MSPLVWLTVPFLPLLAGVLLWLRPQQVAPWYWLACVPALLLSIWPTPALELAMLWPGATWGADDLLARAWLGFSAVLWACASRFAVADLSDGRHVRRFWLFWLLSLTGNLLLVIAQDAASFYIGFTLMSLSAYGLVVHLRGPAPRQAGRIYLQLAVLGEMLIYAGMLLRMHETGGLLGFADWQNIPTSGLTAGLLLIGFGLKAGFWPLHVWLPLAHPAAPAAASAVLSGAMIKAGILGIWRFLPAEDALLQQWALWLLAIGAISAIYGVLLGLLQHQAKATLAYSSVSQMGYLLIILALGWQQPEARPAAALMLALYGVHHGLAKGALFMGAGLSTHVRLKVWHWVLMAIPALALAGLPLSSGAALKVLLKNSVENSLPGIWLTLLSIGSLATLLVVARALWLMRQSQKTQELPAPLASQVLPWALLCLIPIALPWLWPEMREALQQSLSGYALWAAVWPLALGLALSVMAIKLQWRIPAPLSHLPNPARVVSIGFKRWMSRPPKQAPVPASNAQRWRNLERRWNRFFQPEAVAASAWLIGALLLLGWLS
ncbi:complex I subunit 5 family protein [Halopseudomonas pelagia]|uniref:complex I subunit 5 family protein n=1 Tax=Halopseudomonas pelagia TaxID=553151 RepID=UPI0003A09CAF|nr:complex I subunit 5 family protein [Halopseudomonas pelagia]|tara:strand:- start:263 stop:1915 length:1653 start_codon:yes stop_codon:yes gene_type:complete